MRCDWARCQGQRRVAAADLRSRLESGRPQAAGGHLRRRTDSRERYRQRLPPCRTYLMGATNPSNPSGWSGVMKVKTPAGATAGYILLYSNPYFPKGQTDEVDTGPHPASEPARPD